MSSLAVSLFGKQNMESYVSRKINDLLNELSKSGKFSSRLFKLRNNKQLVKSIQTKPELEEYSKYICDLASLAFKVKIIVCSVQSGSPFLFETIYANKFKQEFKILELGNGQFEALALRSESNATSVLPIPSDLFEPVALN